MVVDPTKTHTLKPAIDGQNQLISKTSWQCEIVGEENQPCPEQENEPSSHIQTTKFIPANYLPSEQIIKYTLTLHTVNTESETGYDTLKDCSISL